MFQGWAVKDGGDVAADAGGEGSQSGQVVGFHALRPGGQFVAAALCHDLGERVDVAMEAS